MLEIGQSCWWIAGGFVLAAAGFVVALRHHLTHGDVEGYDPTAAWLRAYVYFSLAWALAAATGTISTVLENPLVFEGQPDDPAWLVWTATVVLVIVVGYWIVWPMGTQSHGHRVVVPDTLVFGISWGVSEGLVYGSVWLTAHRVLRDEWGGPVWVVIVVIVVMSVFSGVGHSRYWDIRVAPEHNIVGWNLRKVVLVHTPNLVLCTVYVTLFENLGIFVGLEALALLGSALFMRFPSFRPPRPRPVTR